jgi:2-dehydro-3-deoxyphosphogluconate aldolase/(4S)-4-hydroxy-2-oxoglutarate aldolase
VVTAWQAGADFVKIFPCGNLGGAKYLKALKGPLPDVEMVPTGGVNLSSAAEMIAAGASALGVGGELVNAKALNNKSPEVITLNAKEFGRVVRLARNGLPA